MPRIIKTKPVTVCTIVAPGQVKIFQYKNFKEAVMYTAMSLYDNGRATKKEAQEWQATIKGAGIYLFKGDHFEFVQTATAEDDLTLPSVAHMMTMKPEDI